MITRLKGSLTSASKPKSKAERYGLKGGVPVVNTPSPAPSVVNTPPEPQHPEDQDLFEDSIPVRDSDDELGPIPPIPIEVGGSIIDSVARLATLPGIQEIRSLMKEVLHHVQADNKVTAEIKVLESNCEFLFDRMQDLNPTSPELNDEVTRMRKELTNTLAHLNHYGTSEIARARSRLAILNRIERCRTALGRIQTKFQLVQGAEILNVQRQILAQQTSSSSSDLQKEIQASEEDLQRIMRQYAGKRIPREMILSEQIVYRGSKSHGDGRRFGVYKGELMNGEKVAIKISAHKPGLHDDNGRNFGRVSIRLAHEGGGAWLLGPLQSYRYFVSPWIPDGDAVRNTSIALINKSQVCFTQVRDAALGLKYLHQLDEPCVHGSIRGENVLIKMEGGIEQGCLNGQIRSKPPPELTGEDGICRWKAPEIIDSISGDPQMDPSSDIWSWAMTALQLYSGLEPYHQHVKDHRICAEIMAGRTPKREDYPEFDKYAPLPDKTWTLLEKCWNMEPEERPTIQDVVDELEMINSEANPDSN
ncbi:protein tyrosine kinase domain-containing protein [Rhizoctonia solani AG-1 IA]|uniref:Protein tyrosine kinase domain-containing protein n=1 Tax=Thanatephorus cucumeris (strain AG1-IA) TaxID=983506 RepID=L8X0P2_THACA|nr:protein tyrosine kinase domain-containing protein [Rhizoctonia solani AG-1 IA]